MPIIMPLITVWIRPLGLLMKVISVYTNSLGLHVLESLSVNNEVN